MNKFLEFFNKRDYVFYYIGTSGYYYHETDKTRNYGVQSPLTYGNLDVAFRKWDEKFSSLKNAPYVVYWVVTNIWIAGSEYVDTLQEKRG